MVKQGFREALETSPNCDRVVWPLLTTRSRCILSMDCRSGSGADPGGHRAGKRHEDALWKSEIQASSPESMEHQPAPEALAK